MRNMFAILVILFLNSCDNNKPNYNLKNIYWNLVTEINSSNQNKKFEQILFVSNDSILLDGRYLIYYLSNDTLIISDTSYYSQRNDMIKLRKNINFEISDYTFPDGEKTFRIIEYFLKSKIIKCDEDSLILEKIKNIGSYCDNKSILKFYSDKLIYDKTLEVDSIEFSSSFCFGECPEILIKIDKNLNYYYWGGLYAKNQGYYIGKIKKSDFQNITNEIKLANINNFEQFGVYSVDAKELNLKIYSKNKIKHFYGISRDFPLRYHNIFDKFNDLYEKTIITKVDTLYFSEGVLKQLIEIAPPVPMP